MFEDFDHYLQDLLLDLPEETLLVLIFKGPELERPEAVEDWRDPARLEEARSTTVFVARNRHQVFTHAGRFIREVYPTLRKLVIIPPDEPPFVYTMGYGKYHYLEHIDPDVFLARAKRNKNCWLLWLHVKATARRWIINWCTSTHNRVIASMDRHN